MTLQQLTRRDMKKEILCGLMILSLTGCATTKEAGKIVKGTSRIVVVTDGVIFTSSKPVKMTMKDGDTEYTYDSQKEGWLSRLMGAFAFGAVATR